MVTIAITVAVNISMRAAIIITIPVVSVVEMLALALAFVGCSSYSHGLLGIAVIARGSLITGAREYG